MTQIFNRREELEKRRALRNNASKAEAMLWQHLKGQKLGGLKFRRQYGVGTYVLDFYCPACKLALEIDGISHDGEPAQAYDAARQQYIEALGIHFLRFTNQDVYSNIEGVLTMIAEYASGTSP